MVEINSTVSRERGTLRAWEDTSEWPLRSLERCASMAKEKRFSFGLICFECPLSPWFRTKISSLKLKIELRLTSLYKWFLQPLKSSLQLNIYTYTHSLVFASRLKLCYIHLLPVVPIMQFWHYILQVSIWMFWEQQTVTPPPKKRGGRSIEWIYVRISYTSQSQCKFKCWFWIWI